MILKTIITSGALLIIYLASLSVLVPNLKTQQHQWESNTIKAENFIYASKQYRSIIVGSSLANRIVTDSIDEFYNLAFSAKGIFDGLKILTESNQLPENVFIETNVILQPEDKEFTNSITNPIRYRFLKYAPGLRSGKQPIPSFLAPPMAFLISGTLYRIKLNLMPSYQTQKKKTEAGIFDVKLNKNIENASVKPDTARLSQALDLLSSYVNKLEKKGINVIFFEMPVHEKIYNLASPTQIRLAILNRFPSSEYKYITLPPGLNFKTTDGVHLDLGGAYQYRSHFMHKVNCNYCNN